jgi:hypothetical protein
MACQKRFLASTGESDRPNLASPHCLSDRVFRVMAPVEGISKARQGVWCNVRSLDP